MAEIHYSQQEKCTLQGDTLDTLFVHLCCPDPLYSTNSAEIGETSNYQISLRCNLSFCAYMLSLYSQLAYRRFRYHNG